MKNFLIAALVLAAYSCAKTDNYAAPNSTYQGNLIDSVTGKNLLTETGGASLMLKQLSWSGTPDPYYIPTKPDGSFEDTRIYSGQYSVLPTQGAFWPTDSVVTQIGGSTSQNFTVVPYLEITHFTDTLSADSLVMTCQLMAPRQNGLPEILEIWPFVNSTEFVGSGAFITNFTISDPSNGSYNLAAINSNWNATIAATTYRLVVHGLIAGRTYFARLGVRVNDSYRKYNFSPIVEVDVPTK
ncbi:DUF3823 domain-containing protein [Dinghuibacter silviterrae]|uniref:Uncharacterized protein DUF3823 n=1 Tax=Dinghuibacter silviterrae TaxID=1539049 RepID=A0A4R8DHA9_9BACT|nr:DUF3823 domain-containing protein [Dinghuibacter silviterrae]TDW96915.1 uncharacterized protein DUF3823 [Dinghuibacter silviterrae]